MRKICIVKLLYMYEYNENKKQKKYPEVRSNFLTYVRSGKLNQSIEISSFFLSPKTFHHMWNNFSKKKKIQIVKVKKVLRTNRQLLFCHLHFKLKKGSSLEFTVHRKFIHQKLIKKNKWFSMCWHKTLLNDWLTDWL